MTWKAEVTWVLPGATLAQVRDMADHSWPRNISPEKALLKRFAVDD